MQLIKIFIGLMTTTIVSSIATPNSLSKSLDRRAVLGAPGTITSIDQFPGVVDRARQKGISAGNGDGSLGLQRTKFTKAFVQEFHDELSTQLAAQANAIVICNVDYKFDGTPLWTGKTNYPIPLRDSVTYDVVVFEKGTFTRNGEGGFQNWASIWTDEKCSQPNEKTITCP